MSRDLRVLQIALVVRRRHWAVYLDALQWTDHAAVTSTRVPQQCDAAVASKRVCLSEQSPAHWRGSPAQPTRASWPHTALDRLGSEDHRPAGDTETSGGKPIELGQIDKPQACGQYSQRKREQNTHTRSTSAARHISAQYARHSCDAAHSRPLEQPHAAQTWSSSRTRVAVSPILQWAWIDSSTVWNDLAGSMWTSSRIISPKSILPEGRKREGRRRTGGCQSRHRATAPARENHAVQRARVCACMHVGKDARGGYRSSRASAPVSPRSCGTCLCVENFKRQAWVHCAHL